jgi:hypothetical protein
LCGRDEQFARFHTLRQRDNRRMYHYNPQTALEELTEEAVLPNPVHVRDMIVRSRLSPDQALELNRKFQEYLRAFGNVQNMLKPILEELAVVQKK